MGVGIQQGLKKIMNTVQDITSILITDQDGVPVVAVGKFIFFLHQNILIIDLIITNCR